MTTTRADYDSPWKEVLERFFPEFMLFFFPMAHTEIDWSRPHEFLDKELQQAVREAETGRHTVDKLVKVWLKDGMDAWVLIHIEVQSQVDDGFPRRMYVYNYRLYDRYGREVISLAVLGDDDSDWRPSEYGYTRWGCVVNLRFPIVKLLDYEAKWAELEQGKNPFAVVVMAHLKTRATYRRPKSRLRWKVELVKGLYARGYSRAQILELFRFIDWLMVLPPVLAQGFRKTIREYEETAKMRYVTSVERLATQEGIEQGILQKAREDVLEILTLRFQTIPLTVANQINNLTDLVRLKLLLKQAVLTPSLAEFQATLAGQEQDSQNVSAQDNGNSR